jgi:hypothetical protein
MILPVTTGPLGLLQFPNFTAMAPVVVTTNLKNFWDLPRITQTETLASAYEHLSGLSSSNPQLLESVGSLLTRLNDGGDRTDADSFIISRLINEWGTLKDAVPVSSPPRPSSEKPHLDEVSIAGPRTPVPGPSPVPPSPRRQRRSDRSRGERNNSIQFYTDGRGGLFPPSWIQFSKEMRDHLKLIAWNLSATDQRALISNEEANAKFLLSALASVIINLKSSLTETGAKGAGQSGLASAPSVRVSLGLVNEMTSFMTERARAGSDLAAYFWQAYGIHTELRMAVNRLTSMRSLLSSLEEPEKNAVEDGLYALDTAFLSFLLEPLADRPVDGALDALSRDEAHGELIAKRLGDLMVGLPMSTANLSGSQHVQLSSIEGLLRSVAVEARAGTPTPLIRAFLRKLLPSEILRLVPLVGVIRGKP